MAAPLAEAYVFHRAFLQHDTGTDHPERPERLAAILRALAARGRVLPENTFQPEMPPRAALSACHPESYLQRFEEAVLAGRSSLDHPDNRMCEATFQAACLAAGGAMRGVDLVEEGRAGKVFCLVRPPGHHAEPDAALGFCFLNNCALAARHWQRAHGRGRVAIVDFDAHHGNGIQDIFSDDPSVLYISIHEHPTFSFPGTGFAAERGRGAGEGTVYNFPLPPGSGDQAVQRICDGPAAAALETFAPEGLVVAAGFDGHRADDMSGLAYSTELYRWLGAWLAAAAGRLCQGRLVAVLEGGYHLQALGESFNAFRDGVMGIG